MKTTEYTLRASTQGDYDFLYRMHVLTMKEYVAATWSWDDAFQEALFKKNFNPSMRQIIVWDGHDVGMISVERKANEVFLSQIEILPEFQGRGIGTVVIKDLMNEAHNRNLPMTLRVLKVNPARKLYERLGFQITGEDPVRYYMKTEPHQARTE